MDIAYIYKSKQMSPTNMLYILSLKIINQLDAGSYTHTLINTIQHLLNYIYFYGIYFPLLLQCYYPYGTTHMNFYHHLFLLVLSKCIVRTSTDHVVS